MRFYSHHDGLPSRHFISVAGIGNDDPPAYINQTATRHKQEEVIMKSKASLTAILAIVLYLFPVIGHAADVPGVPPEKVAEFIHTVIESHRAFYTLHVVERLEEQGGIKADGEWRTHKKTLPLPQQFVIESSNMFATFTGLRYRLISLWPINPKNGPRDQVDKHSLEAVVARPEHPVTRAITVNDQTFFHAIYADVAVGHACVACHNTHPHSPKKDFKVGDVMGGLVIEFPLGNQ
ncbi:MAG: DUF3365 domain-containing protein [Nitrospira sp. CG24C]|jgi:hypothetical protein|nr:MAG: DUF3365 domain-containing protein [Nitrospira sp. CG24C]TKB53158.1 MAG: DUF3365 domain-containing protein [Nitrospira sp.]